MSDWNIDKFQSVIGLSIDLLTYEFLLNSNHRIDVTATVDCDPGIKSLQSAETAEAGGCIRQFQITLQAIDIK